MELPPCMQGGENIQATDYPEGVPLMIGHLRDPVITAQFDLSSYLIPPSKTVRAFFCHHLPAADAHCHLEQPRANEFIPMDQPHSIAVVIVMTPYLPASNFLHRGIGSKRGRP